jgi:glycosyltransferase involved in cell wall biosynthesis
MKKTGLHICFVSLKSYHLLTKKKESMGMGGAELQGLLITRELVRRGHEVSIITFDHNPEEIEKDIPFRLIRTYRQGRSVSLWKIVKAVWDANADVYYLNNAGFILAPVVLAAHLRGKKILFWGASDTNFDPSHKWYRMPTYRDMMMYLWGLKRADAFVVQNTHQKELLLRHFGKTSVIISNGLSPAERISSFDGFVLWVGSMRKVKNPMMYVELARRLPDTKFVMVGGNPLQRDEFYDNIHGAGIEVPNMEFRGFLPFEEVEQLFARASLFVNTSTIEGFPNTFLQAWSRGVPVVSTINVNPDGLITKHQLGAVARDLDEMTALVKKYMNGGSDVSPSNIKAFFDKNLTIAATVDSMEQVLEGMQASS